MYLYHNGMCTCVSAAVCTLLLLAATSHLSIICSDSPANVCAGCLQHSVMFVHPDTARASCCHCDHNDILVCVSAAVCTLLLHTIVPHLGNDCTHSPANCMYCTEMSVHQDTFTRSCSCAVCTAMFSWKASHQKLEN